jgi:hypothetical protein
MYWLYDGRDIDWGGSHSSGPSRTVNDGTAGQSGVGCSYPGHQRDGVGDSALIIFAGKHHLSAWYKEEDLPHDWVIGVSENDWTTSELGIEWLEHFDKYTLHILTGVAPMFKPGDINKVASGHRTCRESGSNASGILWQSRSLKYMPHGRYVFAAQDAMSAYLCEKPSPPSQRFHVSNGLRECLPFFLRMAGMHLSSRGCVFNTSRSSCAITESALEHGGLRFGVGLMMR